MSKHVKYISSEHYGATLDILEKIHYYIPKFFYLLYFLKNIMVLNAINLVNIMYRVNYIKVC